MNRVFRYTVNIFPNISTQISSDLVEETKHLVLLAKRRMNCFFCYSSTFHDSFLILKSPFKLVSASNISPIIIYDSNKFGQNGHNSRIGDLLYYTSAGYKVLYSSQFIDL